MQRKGGVRPYAVVPKRLAQTRHESAIQRVGDQHDVAARRYRGGQRATQRQLSVHPLRIGAHRLSDGQLEHVGVREPDRDRASVRPEYR